MIREINVARLADTAALAFHALASPPKPMAEHPTKVVTAVIRGIQGHMQGKDDYRYDLKLYVHWLKTSTITAPQKI